MVVYKWFVLASYLAILFRHCSTTSAVSSNYEGSVWTKIDSSARSHFEMQPIGDGWISDSRLSCILSCHVRFEKCLSVTFDISSRICKPGGLIVKHQDPIVQASFASLYHSDDALIVDETNGSTISPQYQVGSASSQYQIFGSATTESQTPSTTTQNTPYCNATLGFSLETWGQTTACLYVSQAATQQAIAKERCEEMGASLITVKTLEKFNMMKSVALPSSSIWIGLEDVYKNGSFFWNDGELMDSGSSLWATLWAPTQPGNIPGETCVVSYNVGQLHDIQCTMTCWYICEMP